MAVTLGRSGSLSAPFGGNIISITKTVESEAVDVSNRSNTSGGYRVSRAGLKSVTFEIECHDPGTAMTDLLDANADNGATVTSVTENISVDGAVTFTITVRGGT
jgi:hypothetical protein